MIEFKILDKDLYTLADLLPKTSGSAGIDLKISRIDCTTDPYACRIHTGICVSLENHFQVGLLFARSSCPITLKNSVGVIDSDYQGEIILVCDSVTDIKQGDRVAQLVIMPCLHPDIEVVNEFSRITARGACAFGSTGC